MQATMKGKGYSAHRNVFGLTDGRVMCFEIFPEEAYSNSDSKLRNLIEISGGMVVKHGEEEPYSVKVLDLDWYLDRNLGPPMILAENTAVFSPSFVVDSYLRNELQDLNNYRLGERMPFDVNLIAQRQRTWSDLKRMENKERDLNGAGLANQSLRRNLCKDFPQGPKIVCSRPESICSQPAVTTVTGTDSDIARERACSPVENEIDLESGTNVQENVCLDSTAKPLANPRGLHTTASLLFSSDDEGHSSEEKNQVTRRKFFRYRRNIPVLNDFQSEEPASKKKKQCHSRVYTANRLYFNAKSPEVKNTIESKQPSKTDESAATQLREADVNTEKVHFACSSRAKINSDDTAHPAVGSKIHRERTNGNPSDNATAGSRGKGDDGNFPRNGSVTIKERQDPARVHSRTNIIPCGPHDGRNTSDCSECSDDYSDRRTDRSKTQKGNKSSGRKGKILNESTDEDIPMPPSPDRMSTASKRSGRGDPYTVEDGKALLKFICDNNLHHYYSGMLPWKKAQEEVILEGRTASSMWEHFRKRVIPNLKYYGCSEIDRRKFAEGKKIKEGNRKQTVPKHFHFKNR